MEEDKGVVEFPDVNQKLAAPKKLSAFEKARQDEAAKRQRAEAENAAALKAFESSFGHDDENDDFDVGDAASPNILIDRAPPAGPRSAVNSHEASGHQYGLPPTGPWSDSQSSRHGLGPPPPSLKQKRALDERREREEAMRMSDDPEFGGSESDLRLDHRFSRPDEQRQVEIPKPTIQLSLLPPEMREAEARRILHPHLDVDSIAFLPPSRPGAGGKRFSSAIVTLSAETTRAKIDNAITFLKDKYLGLGYNLSISRHLSSTSLHPGIAAVSTNQSDAPFGAEVPRQPGLPFPRQAPVASEHGGFAPPKSYDVPSRIAYDDMMPLDASVNVNVPLDIDTIRAVHTVADAMLSEANPEAVLLMEMQLMETPEVQKDERFSFLFDSRSPAGVYYRYLLWRSDDPEDAVNAQKLQTRGAERIYEDIVMDWVGPQDQLPFPDLTDLGRVVTDVDYVSSDEESDDECVEPRIGGGRDGDLALEATEKKQLSPLKRARLVHLLSRLPTAMALLLKGDVARVTNFAIVYAGTGAEEITDLLLLNVHKPLSLSLASKFEDSDLSQDSEDEYEPGEDLQIVDPNVSDAAAKRETDDPSNAKLVALYVISDLLSAASTAGARNAWKYRQLFEAGLRHQKTFEHLGKLDKELSWGRLKAEQWKRKIGVIFGIWEGWSVFNSDVLQQMKQSFFEPPLSEEERMAEEAEKVQQESRRIEEKMAGKFKRAGESAQSCQSASPTPLGGTPTVTELQIPQDAQRVATKHIKTSLVRSEAEGAHAKQGLEIMPPKTGAGGLPMRKVQGTRSFGSDGASDLDPANDAPSTKMDISVSTGEQASPPSKPPGPRKRMRAEDMFADSDEE